MKNSQFQLFDYQVPAPPEKPIWPDILRWMICVMDNDDHALPFIASVYAYSLKNGGDITEKQFLIASKHAKRILEQWGTVMLDCQNTQNPHLAESFMLAHMEAKGTA